MQWISTMESPGMLAIGIDKCTLHQIIIIMEVSVESGI